MNEPYALWRQVGGLAKQFWGGLTGNALLRMEGSWDRLGVEFEGSRRRRWRRLSGKDYFAGDRA